LIESFSSDKGTKLVTFAARCIENEILMHLRSLKKTRKDVSLHDPNEITLIDIFGSDGDDVAAGSASTPAARSERSGRS
jgi:RNA polymerase sporulation-specific sigma factor